MKYIEKTVSLNSLVDSKGNDIKNNLEDLIKMNIIKKNNKLFIKTYDESVIKSIADYIKQLEEQLIEVKIAIQDANINKRHKDGHSNNYYIYKLSALNREKADLEDQLELCDTKIRYKTGPKPEGKFKGSNTRILENIPSKRILESIRLELTTRIDELKLEISEIKVKLTEFNETTKVSLKVFEPFEDMIK